MPTKFAYVTLVMKDDSYVPGALVIASSLRRTGSTADIICMVTHDVSDVARSVMGMIYTKVVEVDYINAQPYKFTGSHRQMQEKYYHDLTPLILTKFNCFKLLDYDKVCLLDVDIVVLRCMDAIFDIQTPAGSFYNSWIHNVNLYPHDMQEGTIVPRDCIIRASKLKDGFLVNGSPLVLPTGQGIFEEFKTYINDIQQRDGLIGFSHLCAGLDETTITMFFTDFLQQEWQYVGPDYACVPWMDTRSDPCLYHYIHKKPWTMQENSWPDLKPWFVEAHYIYENYAQTQQFFKFLVKSDRSDLPKLAESIKFHHARVRAILDDCFSNSYDEDSYTRWYNENKTSPMTRQPMRVGTFQNRALMTVIEELKDLMTPGMDFEKPVREDGVTLE